MLPSSLSPDGRLGVLAPDEQHYKEDVPQNKLVETATGRVLADIEATTGVEHMNHGGLKANWSKDGSLLLWVVEGKWFPRAEVLIKLESGKVVWQTNVLKEAQREILARTRKAKPEAYAAAVAHNQGKMGSAYPDGFTVDVKPSGDSGGSPSLPFVAQVTLTSNPKAIEDFPKEAQLDGVMTATIDASGKFNVTHFELGSGSNDELKKPRKQIQ